MANGSQALDAGSIRQLIEAQLVALEQILFVHSELTKRLQDQTGEELTDVDKTLQNARTSAKMQKGPPADRGRGSCSGSDRFSYRCATTGLELSALERKKGLNKMLTMETSPSNSPQGHDRRPTSSLDSPRGHDMQPAEPLLGDTNVESRTSSRQPIVSRTSSRQPDPVSGEARSLAAGPTSKSRSEQRAISKNGLFHDPQQVKMEMRAILENLEHEGEESAHDYHTTGWAQWLAKNDTFKNFTFLMICFSTLWLGIDTDFNKPDATPHMKVMFVWVDILSTLYYTFEIGVRYAAFRKKASAFAAFSFNFDFALVVYMVFDSFVMPAVALIFGTKAHSGTSVLKLLRLFRLMRLARLGRLVRQVPDLVVLMTGLRMATRAVMSTILLLTIIMYVFSVLFVHLLQHTSEGEHCFSGVLAGMNCLLLQGVFVDQARFVTGMLKVHWIYYVLILVYLSLACLAVLNMLIGVVCEVVSSAASAEHEERVRLTGRLKILEALREAQVIDTDVISLAEFKTMLESPSVIRHFKELDIDIFALAECGEFIFYKKAEMSFDEFMSELVNFRGGNTCTTKDAIDMRLFFLREINLLEDRLKCALSGRQTACR